MHNMSPVANRHTYVPEFIKMSTKLKPLEKLTYIMIDSACGLKSFCWPSQKALATMVGCSLSTVIRCIRRLEELGLLKTEGAVHGHTLRYYPLMSAPEQGRDQCHSDIPLCQGERRIKKDNKNKKLPLPPHGGGAMPVRHAPAIQGVGDADFERLWNAYPRHDARAAALSAWDKLRRSATLPGLSTLMASIERARGTIGWQREGGRFVPYLSNWLAGRRWEDDMPSSSESVPVQVSQHPALFQCPPVLPDFQPVAFSEAQEQAEATALQTFLDDAAIPPEHQSMVKAMWKFYSRREGIQLNASDCVGDGPIWNRMTRAAKARGRHDGTSNT